MPSLNDSINIYIYPEPQSASLPDSSTTIYQPAYDNDNDVDNDIDEDNDEDNDLGYEEVEYDDDEQEDPLSVCEVGLQDVDHAVL